MLLDPISQRPVEGGGVLSLMQVRNPRRFYPANADDLREAIRREEFHRDVRRYLELGREHPGIKAAVPGNAYVVSTGLSYGLSAGVARTLIYINSGAANQPSWVELVVGFDGVTASAVPAIVDIVYGTKASNSTPGTNSTTATPVQVRGWPTQSSQQAAATGAAATFEPTVLTANKNYLVTPNGGLLVMQFPMGREVTGVASGAAISGIQTGVRVNAPAAVNCRAYIEYEE